MASVEHCIGCECSKCQVKRSLCQRNENERKQYEQVINLTNILYDALDYHRKENVRLKARATAFKQDTKLESGEKASFKRKLLLFQEEFADLLHHKGELVRKVASLKTILNEKEKELALKNDLISKLESSLMEMQQLLKNLQQKLPETEHKLKLLKEEYDALLIHHSSIEEERQKLENDNQDLLSLLIELKIHDADKLNAETELIQSKLQNKVQTELMAAAEEFVIVDTNRKIQTKLQNELDEDAEDGFLFDSYRSETVIYPDAVLPNVRYKFNAHDGEVNAVAWAHKDIKFVTAGGDGRIKVWEVPLGQACLRKIAHENNSSIYSVDFDLEESLLLTASSDKACRVWSASDLKIKHTLTGHNGKVMSSKFLGITGKVVSGSHDGTLKIWDLPQRACCIHTITVGSSANDVICDSCGINFASGHFDKKIRLWDVRSRYRGNEILLEGKITSLDLSFDGFSLLSCSRDNVLKLIDLRMNKVVHTFSADGFLVGHDFTRAKFNPSGDFCVCGSQSGTIYIWETSSGALNKVLSGHRSTVTTCAWSWCETYLLSGEKNKKAILWSDPK